MDIKDKRRFNPDDTMRQNRKKIILLSLILLSACFGRENKSPMPVEEPKEVVTAPSPPPVPAAPALPTASLPNFAELAKAVKPSVVNISTTKAIQRRLNPYYGPFSPREPSEREDHSLGTGFIIDAQGHIITNNHVVEGADEIKVNLDDGRSLKALIVGRDPRLDIAVLKTAEPGSYPFVRLGDSDALEVGDWVVAVGNPFGLGQTVTAGIVSAKARVLGAGPYDDFIQTDASINPGNSGGPLFNSRGEVVGINTAMIATGQGIGFAIPINMAKDVVPQLIATGSVTRGWLGVAIREMTDDEAKTLGLKKSEGAMVAQVVPGGPAEAAGIKAGDVILSFNGQKIETSHLLPTLVAKVAPGKSAPLIFLNEGKQFERTVTLGSLDEIEKEGGEGEFLGMKVRELNATERRQFRAGLLVTGVAPGSMAASVGIQEGDLLLEINGEGIGNIKKFSDILDALPSGGAIRMGLARGPYIYYFAFRKE
ncbi:MAG: DegQ family serine endoprotease [Deltaproteobacteria bacterium]|nr:DegQ family serine endoprotease [Deltaproteobacteria bacterium]